MKRYHCVVKFIDRQRYDVESSFNIGEEHPNVQRLKSEPVHYFVLCDIKLIHYLYFLTTI